MKTISVKIDDKMYDSFLQRASENNMTRSDFLRQIIIQTLENEKKESKAKTDLKTLQERLEHDTVLLSVSLENLFVANKEFKTSLINEKKR
jgi:hypothetical protein